MAITIVTSIAGSAVDGGDVTLAYDSLQADDVIVTFGGFAGGTETAPGVLGPAGFTSVWTVNSAAIDVKGEWLRVGADAPASVLLSGSGTATDATAYVSYALRGVTNSGDPLDVGIQTVEANGTPQAPSIVTVTDGAMVLALASNSVLDTSTGVVSNFSADISASSNDTDDISSAGAASLLSTAGSISPNAWSSWGIGDYGAMTLAVKPQAAAAGGDPFQSYVSLSISPYAFQT